MVFDNLQHNVCDVMKEYFTKNAHGKTTRNEEQSEKVTTNENGIWTKGTLFHGCQRIQQLAFTGKENLITICF